MLKSLSLYAKRLIDSSLTWHKRQADASLKTCRTGCWGMPRYLSSSQAQIPCLERTCYLQNVIIIGSYVHNLRIAQFAYRSKHPLLLKKTAYCVATHNWKVQMVPQRVIALFPHRVRCLFRQQRSANTVTKKASIHRSSSRPRIHRISLNALGVIYASTRYDRHEEWCCVFETWALESFFFMVKNSNTL